MANVTDSASVLVVPSGWSDGVLGSLQPDDGTGDFTFSRGSDLSATRVNEQGYIERGYENLLLQSNNFDTLPWGGDVIKTGSQEGYDGSNDAWLIEKNVSGGLLLLFQNLNRVQTLSIYAKANTLNWIRVRVGTSGGDAYFNLDPNAVGSRTGIYSSDTAQIEDVGNGWYRCSVSNSGAIDRYRIYPADGDNDISGTSGSVYIQDAQLNQGLVAYPYIETTTTTAKNPVILENQPRVDYTSGNGAVLIEPQKTNLIGNSEYFSDSWSGAAQVTANAVISPEGKNNAALLSDTTLSNTLSYIRLINTDGRVIGETYTLSLYVKPKGNSRSFKFWARNTTAPAVFFDLVSGTTNNPSVSTIKSVGNGWFRVSSTGQLVSGILAAYFYCYTNADNVEGFYIYGAQLEQGKFATSYTPTYGTSQTRLKDTATLTKNVTSTGTIYININAQTSRTLTFLGADISVTKGVNKIAMAYSPTALKVSKNGTIVANITRAFDTTALTQIQLGHRNNFEQTTDSINQFLTLDSFLNDTQLNELTA